jgi:hypothetical protein
LAKGQDIVLPVSLGESRSAPHALAKGQDIVLPVSLGEALDKLTILDIKMRKISDNRAADVKAEHAVLLEKLQTYVTRYEYHYRILKVVNEAIWDIQERFHGAETSAEEGAVLCRNILLENDRRFRVKAKINTLANSVLREQKGYAKKKALVYSHLGLGDMFWMNGAVRYLATVYDEVLVICKNRNAKNTAAMYADDPSIKLLLIDDDSQLYPWPQKSQYFSEQGYKVYSCGQHALKANPTIYDLPNSFYDDMAVPREIRTQYFHVPRTLEAVTLRARFGLIPYIVIHEESSVQKLEIGKKLLDGGEKRLILDLNKNPYTTTHGWWAAAEKVAGLPLLDYTELIEGAEELHMIESSIYCLATHLDLSKVKRKVCYEPWGDNAERLGVFETGMIADNI